MVSESLGISMFTDMMMGKNVERGKDGRMCGYFQPFLRCPQNKEARNGKSEPRLLEKCGKAALLGELFHGRHEADVRAAYGTLRRDKLGVGFAGGSAAILLRAVVAHAGTARDADFPSDSLVTRHLLLDGLGHATLAAGVGGVNLLGDDVIVACLHLARLGAVAGGVRPEAEHRAAGREAHGKGGEDQKAEEFFHRGGSLVLVRKGSSMRWPPMQTWQ